MNNNVSCTILCLEFYAYKIKMPKSDKRVTEDSELMGNEQESKKLSILKLTKATQELPKPAKHLLQMKKLTSIVFN